MPGFPSLQEMVQRELARRQEGDGQYPCLAFVVYDKRHGALTDVEAAVKAIVEQAEDGGDRVYIASSIREAVVAALDAKFPKRRILIRTIVGSAMRDAPIPEAAEGAGPSSPAARLDAVERARERLAKLRGEF